jgi:hypothetical protein
MEPSLKTLCDKRVQITKKSMGMGMGQFFIAVVMASGFVITFGILLFDEWSARRRADRGR